MTVAGARERGQRVVRTVGEGDWFVSGRRFSDVARSCRR